MRTKTAVYVLSAFYSFLLYLSCTTNKPNTSVNVNPSFEMTPPIATSIEIGQAESNTFLLKAAFNPGTITTRFHKILVDTDSLLLRDDGEEGDEKANDNVFSVLIKEDPSVLQSELAAIRTKFVVGSRNQSPLVRFVNRSPVLHGNKQIEDFLRFDTTFKKPFKIIPGLLDAIPPDPLLTSRSLMITDLGVIQDPTRTFNPCTAVGNENGAWTFKTLISNMANSGATGVSPVAFIRSLLRQWLADVSVNTELVAKRPTFFDLVIKPWIIKSNPGMPPASVTSVNWETFDIDLKFAPFRLLAIVNRLDLRGNSGYGFSNAGEGRFVFGLLNSTCAPLRFTIICEYGIPKKNCSDVRAFAQQWVALKTMSPGSAAYNSALEAITVQFTGAGLISSKPNGSAINQIRTNDFAAVLPWELREFVINPASHLLISTTVKKEPIEKFNRNGSPTTPANVNLLRDFINANQVSVVNNTYDVEMNLPGTTTAFLGGKAHTETPGHFWDAVPGQITNDTARHVFSLNTCSGCHGGEGKTSIGNLINDPAGVTHNSFLHISPQPFGTKPTLSAFLTGDPAQSDKMFGVNDPALRPPVWKFNDLLRRAEDLEGLVTIGCRSKVLTAARALSFKPVGMTH